jgi:PAS domain S-box-containing protein
VIKQVFQLVPDALVLVDETGRILEANEQAGRLFGYPREDLLGLAVEQLMPAAARQGHHLHRTAYMDNPRVRPMGASGQSLTGMRRDGCYFPVEIALSPIEVDGHWRYLASIRDVSETQRARQALVRARFDRLVAHVGQLALSAADEDSVITRLPIEIAETLDIEALAIFALRADKARLQLLASHVDVESSSPWNDAALGTFYVAALADRPQIVENLELHRGVEFTDGLLLRGFRSSLVVPLLERDRPLGVILALSRRPGAFDHDTQHCLQSIGNLLSASMQRRRAEERLAHAQRLEAIGQLTGGVAHDFNNLLTVVSGNLQLLELELPENPAVRELVHGALRAVDHGAALTSKLLAFARRQRLTPRAVHPHRLLEDLGTILRRTLGERVRIDISCDASVAPIFADPAQLESALLNLALNARDAMPRGGQLRLAAVETSVGADAGMLDLEAGRYVVFSVVDTGLGMTPEVLARAFEPFFTTKESGKGNGLGLSMVYGFVRQSGGQIRAQSRLGYGTTIEMYFPLAVVDTPAARSPTLQPERADARVKILVVEDEPDVRRVAVAFVQSLGYGVRAVGDAQAALAALDEDRDVAMLFSDVALGDGMNGMELATAALQRRPGLAVLLTSGHDRPASQSNDETSESFELLPKPYRREELAAALRRQLDRA